VRQRVRGGLGGSRGFPEGMLRWLPGLARRIGQGPKTRQRQTDTGEKYDEPN
jgi:hypothetical protein